jgi:hypothetical protein
MSDSAPEPPRDAAKDSPQVPEREASDGQPDASTPVLRHLPDEETLKRLAPAEALSIERLKAAGVPAEDLPR